jgi:hypothetical protein
VSGFLKAGFLRSDQPIKKNRVRCANSTCGQWLVELDPTRKYVVANNGEFFAKSEEFLPRKVDDPFGNDDGSNCHLILLSDGDRIHCRRCTTEWHYRDGEWFQLVSKDWTVKPTFND